MSVASCPSCGAPIEFAIGTSAVVVCGYCRSVVARTDRGVESHGQVAALVDTGSPLHVGMPGSYRGKGFRITGRTQLRHQAGGVWDEWYAAFDDGRWGWLAEAQGRFYVTFRVAADAPAYQELQLGGRVPSLDDLTVAEIGEAALASAEGELPWTPIPGSTYAYADLTGAAKKFATIDYSEEPPIVFKGYETTLEELGIRGEAARKKRVATTALNCSQCGGALELRAPDETERVWCPYCGSGHDVTDDGKLRFFRKLKGKVEPVIPLGTTGTIDGDPYVVAGFMQRSVKFDIHYYWTEYLLYNKEKGFRWLVHSDDHWSFVTPLRPGEVTDGPAHEVARNVHYDGRQYRLFQTAAARVTYVVGEFYWKVEVGETVDTADYIAPPFGISKEVSQGGARELSYSHARYMQPKEVEAAFGVKGLPKPRMVGPMQPYGGPLLHGPWLLFLAILVAAALFLAIRAPNRVLAQQWFDLVQAQAPEGGPPNTRVFFVEPFAVSGEHNVMIEAGSSLDNEWLYVAGDFVNEDTGRVEAFELPLEYYWGVDSGERWSEGNRTKRVYISRPQKGRYALRFELQWDANKRVPPPLHVLVQEGVFRWPHFILTLIAISIFPAIAVIMYLSFEAQRWKESAHSPFGQFESGDDDEE
ncbi:MAG TPA: DUF4178 domain-containing protein [Thermoanaerobaculia bacterium]|nr:DUF4178 domain-containing protein [Thermoanaerobaculia bacterium]